MARFLHTADWQIGRQYGQIAADDAVPLAEARFGVLERLARLAVEHKVDAVLVAGDVFDAQTVSDRTIRRLFNAIQAFSGPWIMIPGNHDAALAESVWARADRLQATPANVRIALKPGVLDFSAQGFAVLAAPLTQRHTYNDLTEWFDTADTAPDLLRIGLAHGSVQGILAEDIDSPNPIASDRATRARLDYLALGDWHGTKQIDARTWYSGTPEQDRFRDNGAGQALLVDIDAPGAQPRVTNHMVGQFSWRVSEARLSVASDVDVLLNYLSTLNTQDVVRLRLIGQTDLTGHQRICQALSEAEGRARSLDVEFAKLCLMPTDEDIAILKANGYLADVIADLRDQQQNEAGDTAREALAILASILVERQAWGGAA
jgi:DNA repair exonuclease SbcCD nuclease subunit